MFLYPSRAAVDQTRSVSHGVELASRLTCRLRPPTMSASSMAFTRIRSPETAMRAASSRLPYVLSGSFQSGLKASSPSKKAIQTVTRILPRANQPRQLQHHAGRRAAVVGAHKVSRRLVS